MPREIHGQLNAAGMRIGIVVARFNELVTQQLLKGAEDAVQRHGGDPASATVAWVPGSFEIPVVVRHMAASGDYDAIVALGALIRGATPHFDHLASSVTGALQGIAVESGVPVINGVLTTDNLERAVERSGTKAGNKGFDAAVAAIEMVAVIRGL